MKTLDKIASNIIKEQSLIIGPLAWTEAMKVPGLHVVNRSTWQVDFNGNNPMQVLDGLVHQYEHLFGRASREVCKEAAAPFLSDLEPNEELPTSLK